MDRLDLWNRNWDSLALFRPELMLAVAIVAILGYDLLIPSRRARENQWTTGLALFGLLISGALLLQGWDAKPQEAFLGMVAVDRYGMFFRLLALAVTLVVVVMASNTRETQRENVAEFNALLLVMCLAMMFLASARDLIMIYLALETLSISSYILAGYTRGSRRSSEAALKYLLYGAVASGTMLFGLSLLYGLAGSTDLHHVGEAVQNASQGGATVAAIAAVLTFVGFGYKIAAAPFHMWAPDVYEGAPTPITAILTVGSKAAGFAAFIRFFLSVLSLPVFDDNSVLLGWKAVGLDSWPFAIGVISALTMTVGNLAAIPQTNVKRLLGYSSIAHAGYMLMGLTVVSVVGLRAVIFYIVVYYFMNLGAFLVVTVVSNHTGGERIEDFKGLGWRSPFAAAAMALFLFSLVGLPPLAGFIGKYHLFFAVIQTGQETGTAWNWYYTLAVIAALNAVVSLFYYARVIKAMYLDRSEETARIAMTPAQAIIMGVLMIPTVGFGLAWGGLMTFVVEPATKLLDASL